MVLRAVVQQARARLIAAGVEAGEAGLDAELLTRQALGWDRATLVARLGDEPPAGLEAALVPLLERRVRREPMAYILGVQEFWGRDFRVGPGVLIPRPETELLIEAALEWARARAPSAPPVVVDVGTGSGCLAITLALELAGAVVHATDISPAALAVAEDNARRFGATVRFHRGPLFAAVPPPVDLLVSNPPYVTRAAYASLPPEVRAYEPELALVGGEDGLDVIRQVLVAAGRGLRPGGWLLLEIGYDQAEAVARLAAEVPGLELLRIAADLQGIPRAVVAARGARDGSD